MRSLAESDEMLRRVRTSWEGDAKNLAFAMKPLWEAFERNVAGKFIGVTLNILAHANMYRSSI